MTPLLLPASSVRVGDLLESPTDQVWRPVLNIDRQYGRLWFIMGVWSRSAAIGEIVAVGRVV